MAEMTWMERVAFNGAGTCQDILRAALEEATERNTGYGFGMEVFLRQLAGLDQYFVVQGKSLTEVERYFGFGAATLREAAVLNAGTVVLGRVPAEHARWLEQRFGSGMMGCQMYDDLQTAVDALFDRHARVSRELAARQAERAQ